MTGERLRLAVLLSRGPAPDGPSATNAYRDTHRWVSVTDDRARSEMAIRELH